MNDYAFIKNNKVINIAVFENPSDELLNTFKVDQELDLIIPATHRAGIGGSWDGTDFILVQPFPSWSLDSEKNWQAPTPKPNDGIYNWDEQSLSWVKPVILDS